DDGTSDGQPVRIDEGIVGIFLYDLIDIFLGLVGLAGSRERDSGDGLVISATRRNFEREGDLLLGHRGIAKLSLAKTLDDGPAGGSFLNSMTLRRFYGPTRIFSRLLHAAKVALGCRLDTEHLVLESEYANDGSDLLLHGFGVVAEEGEGLNFLNETLG